MIMYQDKIFKPYDDMYYVSADGDVYSLYKKGLLKHYIDCDGYHRVDIHGKHMKIHKLVYMTWVGEIPKGKQVNHYDDDKDNNTYSNLYLGNQKENIQDCIRNNHRIGNRKEIVVFDKETKKVSEYPRIKDFLATTGHPNANGSLSKCLNRKWFNERYVVISRNGVETIESYKSIRAS